MVLDLGAVEGAQGPVADGALWGLGRHVLVAAQADGGRGVAGAEVGGQLLEDHLPRLDVSSRNEEPFFKACC